MDHEMPFIPGGVVDDVYRYRLKIHTLEAENQRLHDHIKGYERILADHNISIDGTTRGERPGELIQLDNTQHATPWMPGELPTQSIMKFPTRGYPSPGVEQDPYPSSGIDTPGIDRLEIARSTPFEDQLGCAGLVSPMDSPLHHYHTTSNGSDGKSSLIGVSQYGQQDTSTGNFPMPVADMGSHMPMLWDPACAEPMEPSTRDFNSPYGQLNLGAAIGTFGKPLPKCRGIGKLMFSIEFMPNNAAGDEYTNDSLQLSPYDKAGFVQDEIPVDPQLETIDSLPSSNGQIHDLNLPVSATAVQGRPVGHSGTLQPDIVSAFLQGDLWTASPAEAPQLKTDGLIVTAEGGQIDSSFSNWPRSSLDDYSTGSPCAAATAANNTDPTSRAVQVGFPSVQVPTVHRFLNYVGAYAVGSHMTKMARFKRNGDPNRPWIFGYTFPGTSEYGLYYLSCPKNGCTAKSYHPLIDGRGAQHMRDCGCEFGDEVDMIRKYGTQGACDSHFPWQLYVYMLTIHSVQPSGRPPTHHPGLGAQVE